MFLVDLQNASSGSHIINVLVMALAVFGSAYVLKGIEVKNFVSALVVAVIISLLNATIGVVLDFLATPLTWITLGFFTFVVDAAIIMIANHFLSGLKVKNFWWAILMAIIVSVTSGAMIHLLF